MKPFACQRATVPVNVHVSVLLYVLVYMPDSVLCVLPEWVFVAAVALGSVLFLLLVGVCWCQCCPHSCCCYVSCWCCPDTCCCPRHCEYKHKVSLRLLTAHSFPQSEKGCLLLL